MIDYDGCPDCVLDLLEGPSGRCKYCDGTGINTQLNSDEPKCPHCNGTGICSTCKGRGRLLTGSGGGGIQTLFGS